MLVFMVFLLYIKRSSEITTYLFRQIITNQVLKLSNSIETVYTCSNRLKIAQNYPKLKQSDIFLANQIKLTNQIKSHQIKSNNKFIFHDVRIISSQIQLKFNDTTEVHKYS